MGLCGFAEAFGQIFVEGLKGFKDMFVTEFTCNTFTSSRAVFAADQGSFVVDLAKVVFCQEMAFAIDIEIPFPLINIDRNTFMRDKPPDIFKFFFTFRRIYLKRKISATF